jgi:hypothetical protein
MLSAQKWPPADIQEARSRIRFEILEVLGWGFGLWVNRHAWEPMGSGRQPANGQTV